MPQFSDAFVLFASMMQMYEIFMIYARKTAIIFQKSYLLPLTSYLLPLTFCTFALLQT